jgi:hypothetical protein
MSLIDTINEILKKDNISGMTRLPYYQFVSKLWIELDKYEKTNWETITKKLIVFYSVAYGLNPVTLHEIVKQIVKHKVKQK